MAMFDKRRKGSGQANQATMKIRMSQDTVLRYCIYAIFPNPFVKTKNLKNLEKFVNLVDIDESFDETNVVAKEFFLILKLIVPMITKNEISGGISVLYDLLLERYTGSEIQESALNELFTYLNDFDISQENLPENEVLQINAFIEEKLKYGYLNTRAAEMSQLANELIMGNGANSSTVEKAEELIVKLHTDLTKTKTLSAIEDNTINFTKKDEAGATIVKYAKTLRSDENRLKCGYKALNRMVNGGFQAGRQYIFLGTPKSFKSGVLLNVALSVAEHNKIGPERSMGRRPVVLYYSMENDSIETLDRIFYYFFGQGIKQSHLTLEQVKDELFRIFDSWNIGFVIKYAPSQSVDTDHLYDVIQELREEGNECIMIVQDYLRRIKPAKWDPEPRIAMGNITDEFSIIAKTMNIPVITASQLNREAVNIREKALKGGVLDIGKQLFISHIAESIQIQQNMDYGIIVSREDVKREVDDVVTTTSFIGMKMVACREKRDEDANGNFLEYFALPFDNGFRIAHDEGTSEEKFSESIAMATMSEQQIEEYKAREAQFNDALARRVGRATGIPGRAPSVIPVTPTRGVVGTSSGEQNRPQIRERLQGLSRMNDPLNDI